MGSVRIEVRSATENEVVLEPFRCAVTVTAKWLKKKKPLDLIALFLKHYGKRFGDVAWECGDFELLSAVGQVLKEKIETDVVVRSIPPVENGELECLCRLAEAMDPKPTTQIIYGAPLAELPRPSFYARVRALIASSTPVVYCTKTSVALSLSREVYAGRLYRARSATVGQLPRRAELGAVPPLRSRWHHKEDPELPPPDDIPTPLVGHSWPEATLLAYVGRNVLDAPRGDIMTYEAVLALATYLQARLALKPIGYRDCVVQMHGAKLGKALTKVDRELQVHAGADNLEVVNRTLRPAIILSAWTYRRFSDWLDHCKNSVHDPDGFELDVPEIVLIGPTEDLLALRIEGYQNHHLTDVSRHLLHIKDLAQPHYGHLVCVSLRSKGNRLSMFRTQDEVDHSRAQGTVAKILAQAQRGQPPSQAELRQLEEAQEVIQNTPPSALREPLIREADGTEQTLEDGSVNLGGCVTVTADARRSWCEAAKPGAKIKLGDKPASLMPSVKYFIDSTATIEVDGMSYELESDAPPPAVDPALKAAMDAFKASIDR